MNEALNRFRATGMDFVMLHVNVNNPIAVKTYVRCGFEVVGCRARYKKIIDETLGNRGQAPV